MERGAIISTIISMRKSKAINNTEPQRGCGACHKWISCHRWLDHELYTRTNFLDLLFECEKNLQRDQSAHTTSIEGENACTTMLHDEQELVICTAKMNHQIRASMWWEGGGVHVRGLRPYRKGGGGWESWFQNFQKKNSRGSKNGLLGKNDHFVGKFGTSTRTRYSRGNIDMRVQFSSLCGGACFTGSFSLCTT